MDNAKQAKDLVNILREAKQEVDPKLIEMSKIHTGGGGMHVIYLILIVN
jgi:ATP-dependent RNA helicase DDX5/DBP2